MKKDMWVCGCKGDIIGGVIKEDNEYIVDKINYPPHKSVTLEEAFKHLAQISGCNFEDMKVEKIGSFNGDSK